MFVRVLRCLRVCVAALCILFGAVHEVQADSRTDFLVRMLATSSQFRVRAQAALALGASASDPTIAQALSRALRSDEHPAVRAASASALENAGSSSVAVLREALRDDDKAVRAAAKTALEGLERSASLAKAQSAQPSSLPRDTGRSSVYYVGVGVPATRVPDVSQGVLRSLREHVAREIVQISGVRLAPEQESHAAAERELKSQKMTGYFIDSSITSVETKPDGSVRAQVSVIVGTYPGRDMRAMLSGAATVSGVGTSESARLEAIQAAYTGALRRLPQAMQAGLARAP